MKKKHKSSFDLIYIYKEETTLTMAKKPSFIPLTKVPCWKKKNFHMCRVHEIPTPLMN